MGEEIPPIPPILDPEGSYRVYVDAWKMETGDAYTCEGEYLGAFNDVVSGINLTTFLNEPADSPPSPPGTSRQCNVFYQLIDIIGETYSKQRVIAIIIEA